MIGRIKGILEQKQPPEILVDVNGIGYEIQMPMTSIYELPEIGEEVIVHTHLVVREDAHLLFGFSDQNERSMFRKLIKTNGVGAKMALTILSTMSSNEFLIVINQSDINSLVKIPGIGKKTAERLLIEMRDKLQNISVDTKSKVQLLLGVKEEAISGLVSLGYKSTQAEKVIESIYKENTSSEELMREALKNLI